MIEITNAPKLMWAKVEPTGIIPVKRDEDAGYDLYACFEEDYKIIKPGQTVLVPTGIASVIPKGYVMIIKDRSSMWKIGLKRTAGVIDSGYRGQWYVAMTNVGTTSVVIAKDEQMVESLRMKTQEEYIYFDYNKAIAQAVLLEVPDIESVEVSYEDVKTMDSERQAGGFGSTGK